MQKTRTKPRPKKSAERTPKQGTDAEALATEAVSKARETGHVREHDTKTCRLYGCLLCKLKNVKDEKRGL